MGFFMVIKHVKPLNLLDGTTNAPMSIQVARLLINEIKTGVYSPGQKMESIRTLAERLGVGRQIVLSAFETLAKHNYICCAVGRAGSFVNPALKPGLYYRMGLFLNRNNPTRYGLLINSVFEAASRNGWQVVLGYNFEENIELVDWVKSKKDIDGVIITGIVDEYVLKGFKELCVPYLVLGNYDLAPVHPQIGVNFYPIIKDTLSDILKENNIRNLTAVLGPEIQRNERELASAVQKVCFENGIEDEDFTVVHSNDGGFLDVCRIMKDKKPGAFFFWGEHARAWAKYQENNEISDGRPLIIVNKKWTNIIDKKYYDIAFEMDIDIENTAVDRMISIIEGKDGAI